MFDILKVFKRTLKLKTILPKPEEHRFLRLQKEVVEISSKIKNAMREDKREVYLYDTDSYIMDYILEPLGYNAEFLPEGPQEISYKVTW